MTAGLRHGGSLSGLVGREIVLGVPSWGAGLFRAIRALLRNDGGNRKHWLGLTLVGKDGPVTAIGAKVTVTTGDRKQVGVDQWATSYLSYNDPRMHFGLGDNAVIDQLEVRWNDGRVEVYRDVPADRYLTIVQGKGLRRR